MALVLLHVMGVPAVVRDANHCQPSSVSGQHMAGSDRRRSVADEECRAQKAHHVCAARVRSDDCQRQDDVTYFVAHHAMKPTVDEPWSSSLTIALAAQS
jgi:hypothetical protein